MKRTRTKGTSQAASATSFADVADLGDEIAARGLVRETLSDIHSQREAFVVKAATPREAVRQAVESDISPVILVDVADNIGGGSAGDGTELLRELITQNAERAVVVIADAQAVDEASRAGPGGSLETLVGGKSDRIHGSPVPLRGTVLRILDGHYKASGSWMTGHDFSMGSTAVIQTGGVTLIITEFATPPFHREQLTSVGVDPSKAKIIVAKGAVAWRSAYGDIATSVIPVDTRGACPIDPTRLPRRSVAEPVLP